MKKLSICGVDPALGMTQPESRPSVRCTSDLNLRLKLICRDIADLEHITLDWPNVLLRTLTCQSMRESLAFSLNDDFCESFHSRLRLRTVLIKTES